MATPYTSAEPAHLLILHAGALGDCVLALSVARGLAASRRGTQVDMAARSPIAEWAKQNGLLHDALPLAMLGGHLLHQEDGQPPPEAVSRLGRYANIISFLGGPEENVSRNLARWFGSSIIAIHPAPSRETARTGRHITRQWTDVLATHGFDITCPRTAAVPIAQSKRGCARARLARVLSQPDDRSIALCHPGSGGTRKCLPIETMERLMAKVVQDRQRTAAWIIGPDEVERSGSEFIRRLSNTAPVLYEEDVPAVAQLVCGASSYIGYDAGMTHVAALAGVPTVAIFGPTDPRVWRPLGPCCTVVRFPPGKAVTEHWIDDVSACIQTFSSGSAAGASGAGSAAGK